mgnify:CR=1 FL=1
MKPGGTERGPHQTLVGVQYVRGVAAMLVVFYHAAAQVAIDPFYGRIPHPALEYGYVGVPVFFLVSGLIIAMVSLDSTWAPRLRPRDFAEKRVVRILPFMWLAIIAYNALSFAGTGVVEWNPFWRAMVLWPSGTVKPNIIWTLRHEAMFYIVFALSFLGCRRRLWLIAAWCLSPIVMHLLLPALPRETASDPSLQALLFADVNIMFGAGLLVGLFTLRRCPQIAPTWRGGAAAVYAGGIAVALLAYAMNWREGFVAYAWLTLASVPLVILAVRLAPSRSILDRAAGLIGDASYAIYLVHNLVIVPAIIGGRRVIGMAGLWPTYLAIVAMATIAGILAHLFIEKPLIAAVSRRLPRNARPFVNSR